MKHISEVYYQLRVYANGKFTSGKAVLRLCSAKNEHRGLDGPLSVEVILFNRSIGKPEGKRVYNESLTADEKNRRTRYVLPRDQMFLCYIYRQIERRT